MEIKATEKFVSVKEAPTASAARDVAAAEPAPAADAVKVALSDAVKSTISTAEKKTKQYTDARLKEIADKAEANFAGTKVQFGPARDSQEDPPAINFRVLDKETGRVIREFPAEEIESLVESFDSKEQDTQSAFVAVVA